MKTKHFFLVLVAGLAVLASCKQENPVFGIETSLEGNTLVFSQEGGTQQFQVITDQKWEIKKPESLTWATINPKSGIGTTTVEVCVVDPNNSKKKKNVIKVDAGVAGYVNVTIQQDGPVAGGDGLTLATAWSPSEAKDWILANLPKETTGSSLVGSGDQKYWIKGFIHKVNVYNEKVENFANSGDFGNATFYISDSMTETENDVTCYQVYYLGNKKFVGPVSAENPDIKEGDEVVIYGSVANYNGKANTLGKGAAFVYSLNGVNRGGAVTEETDPTGTGTLEDPFNAAGAIQYIKSAAYDADARMYVRGVISDRDKVEGEFNANLGTAIFSISEDGADYKTQFKCYGVYYLGNNPWIEGYANVKPGDEVVVYGKLTKYQTLYETADKEAYIYSLNGNTVPEPAFFVPKTEYTVPANTTEYEFDVLGSVAWTATASAGAAIDSPDGGNGTGSGKVKVTFPANTDEAAGKVYTVTVSTEAAISTEAKSFTVTINQGRAIAGGGLEVIFDYSTVSSNISDNAEFPTGGGACTCTINKVTLAMTRGARNTKLSDLRLYQNETMTISVQDGTIIQIDLTCSATDSPDNMLDKFGTGAPAGLVISSDNATGTWTGSAPSVAFTATTKQVRMTQIKVVYIPN